MDTPLIDLLDESLLRCGYFRVVVLEIKSEEWFIWLYVCDGKTGRVKFCISELDPHVLFFDEVYVCVMNMLVFFILDEKGHEDLEALVLKFE